MPRRRHSFQEDLSELLIRFAHRGTPAALQDQLREEGSSKESMANGSRSFDPHQALFERAQD
jgi:hypothetical protein